MLRGLYAAATALDAAGKQQEVTAQNLAHASMPGYREHGVTFETFDRVLGRVAQPTGDIVGTRIDKSYHDFRPGAMIQTGNSFDLALGDHDTFFQLNGPNGPLYTRNGSFHLDRQGRLVSTGGYALNGEAGALQIPNGTVTVVVASDGNVTADGQPVGRIQLVRATDPKQLGSVGPTLFTAPQEAGIQASPGRVLQGYREGSNVQPADAMVRMIIGARYYDATQRALRTLTETVQLNTRPTG